MKVKVDRDKCLGCAMCLNLCPEVFEFKDGKSQVKKGIDLEKYKKCIQQAAQNCPARAIKIED